MQPTILPLRGNKACYSTLPTTTDGPSEVPRRPLRQAGCAALVLGCCLGAGLAFNSSQTQSNFLTVFSQPMAPMMGTTLPRSNRPHTYPTLHPPQAMGQVSLSAPTSQGVRRNSIIMGSTRESQSSGPHPRYNEDNEDAYQHDESADRSINNVSHGWTSNWIMGVVMTLGVALMGAFAAMQRSSPRRRRQPIAMMAMDSEGLLKNLLPDSVQALMDAEAEGQQRHGYVGPEHLLWALAAQEGGIPHQLFKDLGVTIEQVRIVVDIVRAKKENRIKRKGPESLQHEWLYYRKTMMESAARMTVLTGNKDKMIAPVHLFLGCVTQADACWVIQELGILPESMTEKCMALIMQDMKAESKPEEQPQPQNVAAQQPTPVTSPVTQDTWESLTPNAVQALMNAQKEGKRYNWVGPEHIFLALCNRPGSLEQEALARLGKTPEHVRFSVASVLEPKLRMSQSIDGGAVDDWTRFCPSSEAVICFSADLAVRSGSDRVHTYHLFVGFLEQPGVGEEVLAHLGIKAHDLTEAILKLLEERSRPSLLDKLSPSATQILMDATTLSESLKDGWVGPEHLLLALCADEKSFTAVMLRQAGVTIIGLADMVDKFLEPKRRIQHSMAKAGTEKGKQTEFNPSLERILAASARMAKASGHDQINTGHVFLGCLTEQYISKMLAHLGASPEELTQRVIACIANQSVDEKLKHIDAAQAEAIKYAPTKEYATAMNRLHPYAVQVLMDAETEGKKHGWVGPEHLILALCSEGSIGADVLEKSGVSKQTFLDAVNVQIDYKQQVRNSVEKTMGNNLNEENPHFGPGAEVIIEESAAAADLHRSALITPDHLLLGCMKDPCIRRLFETQLGIDPKSIPSIITQIGILRQVKPKEEVEALQEKQNEESAELEKELETPILSQFGVDLTQLAREGKLDPCLGRDDEIQRVVEILGRKRKNNACLIGEPGVGKTAVAEGLAQRIVDSNCPEIIADMKVFSLDIPLMVAGTKNRGDFELRITGLLTEVKERKDIVVVIDELHTIVGAGGRGSGMNISNLIKPALARGELRCIGATTFDEYRKYIEQDPALERRFQPVEVAEPTEDQALQILQGLKGRYEEHHKLTYSDKALKAAVKLASQYISDRFLPDKAIDCLDEAGSALRIRTRHRLKELEANWDPAEWSQYREDVQLSPEFKQWAEDYHNKLNEKMTSRPDASTGEMEEVREIAVDIVPEVTEADIQMVVSDWTGIPLTQITADEATVLCEMEQTLHERVVAQHEAVSAVSRSVRRSRAGLSPNDRPMASFIFAGPTGVGKTELAKAMAKHIFGGEKAIIRLDMSEYMERHTVAKLIGAPPGYVGYDEGGQLTEAVRRNPYSLVLFDEIEKAHPDVFNIMLQLLDDGRLTDSKGRVVDFTNTLIIMTSNVGSSVIEKGGSGLGFQLATDKSDDSYQHMKELLNDELKNHFHPEFLNRLDDIIVFRQLTKPEIGEIADLMLKEVTDRAATAQNITVKTTEAFRSKCIEEGYDPAYGARPLRRTITRLVEDTLSEQILQGVVHDGDVCTLDLDFNGDVFVTRVQGSVALPRFQQRDSEGLSSRGGERVGGW